MKTSSIALLLLIGVVLLSCSAKPETPSESADILQAETADERSSATVEPAQLPQADLYAHEKLKLIKTVDYRFEVNSVKASTEAIEAAIRKYPAYLSASNLRLENPILENKMSIRVQSEFFYDLLREIDTQAQFVNYREVKTNDVSKEFVDLESRLKTKREVEARYAEILRSKAGKIEELLNAEEKIGELHEEIEATISRMNYLKSQVSYSTINLEFYQKITEKVASAADQETTPGKFAKALETGWATVVTVLIALTYLWPLFILAGIISAVYFFRIRKTRVV